MTGLAQQSSGEVMLCFNNSFLQCILITHELHLPTKVLVRFLGSLCFESSKAQLKGSLQIPLETDLNKQITGFSSHRVMNWVITAVYIPTSKPSNKQVRFIKASCVMDIPNPQSKDSSVPSSTNFTPVAIFCLWQVQSSLINIMPPVKCRWKSVCYQQFLRADSEYLKQYPVLNKPIDRCLGALLENQSPEPSH